MDFKSEVNSYEDVCKILNIDSDLKPDVSVYAEEDKEAAISMFRLWKANKVAWNGEIIDIDNFEQDKYEVQFFLDDEAGLGLGFAYKICVFACTEARAGVRLLWPNATIGKHIAKVMQHDFINVMKIPEK